MRLTIACLLVGCAAGGSDLPVNYVAGPLIELNDNGAWSWFMDERAIVHDGKLIVGSVRAVGDYRNDSAPGWGNVEIAVYDLASGRVQRTVLHRHLQQDDHDNPAFLALPDGRYLAVYTQHGVERRIYYRVSEPRNPLSWGPAETFDTPGDSASPLRGNNVTYSNLFRLASGRIMNFFRGFDLDPNYMYSDDSGRTWRY
ncbi:MAG TPA: BNR-4 repeat-containing protein, partial [Gemmatimonadales bacterium]|nr:BNR-4 repeat-containing protein [Gemmatimonadales bacterium]